MEAKTSRMRAKAVIGLLCCAIFAFGQTPVPFSTLPTYKGVTDTANDRIVFLKYNNGTGKYGNYIISPGTIEKTIVQDSGIAPGYGINKTNAKPRVLSADTTTSTGLVSKSRLTKAIAGAGTVKSVATGYGLSGGTITSTGTLVADTTVLTSQTRLTKSLVLYQKSISLTTTGTSGSASFSSNTLNIPTYQSAYTNLTTIGGLSNASGYLFNNGSGTFTYGNPIQDSGAANSWGLKITAAKPRLFKVDTATGHANGARLATQYWVTQNAPKGSGWGLTGNSGTTAGTNFIGTTDNVGLVFKVNSTLSGGVDIVNNNTSLGYSSLANNTSGSGKYNSALGYNALQANTTGSYNTSMGTFALAANTTGNYNSALGYNALTANLGGNYNSALGYNALMANLGGLYNTAIGTFALTANLGSNNSALGYNALAANTTGASNTSMGTFALTANTTGYNNTAIGTYALTANTTGYFNTMIGAYSGAKVTGNSNTGIGYGAFYPGSTSITTTGIQNIAIGYFAGQITTGSGNINIGANTVAGQSGYFNIGIGTNSSLVTGAANGTTIIGGFSAPPAGNITGSYNTLFGYNVASTNLSTGTNNIIIGVGCDMPVGGGAYSNSLILSSGTGATVNGSNMGVITNGSSYSLKLGVNQSTPTAALHVTGIGTTSSTNTLRIENSSNTASLLIKDNGQISVNNTSPDASAIIDIETTTQGFLPPQMTTTQKNSISSPKEGLVVYDLTLHKLSYYNGSSWTNL